MSFFEYVEHGSLRVDSLKRDERPARCHVVSQADHPGSDDAGWGQCGGEPGGDQMTGREDKEDVMIERPAVEEDAPALAFDDPEWELWDPWRARERYPDEVEEDWP